MAQSAQYLTIEEQLTLEAAFSKNGSGPAFWQAYQEIQEVVRVRTGDTCEKVANEMAGYAQRLGATQGALLL